MQTLLYAFFKIWEYRLPNSEAVIAQKWKKDGLDDLMVTIKLLKIKIICFAGTFCFLGSVLTITLSKSRPIFSLELLPLYGLLGSVFMVSIFRGYIFCIKY